eukprot:6622976-Pyramimonas_sp.AAC.1
MPRNALLPSRVLWVSWVSVVFLGKCKVPGQKNDGFLRGFLAESFLWPSSYCTPPRAMRAHGVR